MNFSLVEYGKNKEQLDEKSAVLRQAEEQFSAVAAEEAGAEAEASRLGNEIIDKEHRLSETGNSLVAAQSKIDQKLQRIEFLRARTVELEQRRSTAAQEIERLRAQGEALKSDLAKHRDDLAGCDRTVAERNEAIERDPDEWSARSICRSGRCRRSWRTRSPASSTSCGGRPSFTTRSRASPATATTWRIRSSGWPAGPRRSGPSWSGC